MLSLPVFESLHGYRRAWLRPDVIAGLTLWAQHGGVPIPIHTHRRRRGTGPVRVMTLFACRKEHR
ncbi:hypothetical protein [Nocardia sp. NPDC058633]|uniref:hypothetical protein n=1 Tax=Nocardia sp. NPDC058633 TaxID=3346568 RepID=UPI0036524969